MIANIHPYDVAQVISANANISAVLPGGFWA